MRERPVDADALTRLRDHLPEALEVRREPGAWWVRLEVEASSDQEAAESACLQVQAAALVAGVPDWPITSVSADGGKSERDVVGRDGSVAVEVSWSSSMTMWGLATSGEVDGGDEDGVREPRRPLPPYPSAGAEAERP